jgi:hypothetical protein
LYKAILLKPWLQGVERAIMEKKTILHLFIWGKYSYPLAQLAVKEI